MMQLKGFKELCENLILSAFSAFDIRMHTGVVFVTQIGNREDTVSVEVERLESSDHNLLSEKTQWALYYSHELVEVNHAIAIYIEGFEQTVNVLGVNIDTKIVDCFCEFVLIKSTRVVVVHDFETASETNQASVAPLNHLRSKSLN